MPPGCKIVRTPVSSWIPPKRCFRFEMLCPNSVAVRPPLSVGRIDICRLPLSSARKLGFNHHLFTVQDIIVDKPRHGFGTRLYEAAAQEACRRRGKLASEFRVHTSASYLFWLKQEAKGRAKRYSGHTSWWDDYSPETHDLFVLDCDDASDLSGIGKK